MNAINTSANAIDATFDQHTDSVSLPLDASSTGAIESGNVWPIRPTYPDTVKEFLKHYYPNGLVCLHNTFLAYADGYWKPQNDFSDIQSSIAKFYAGGATMQNVKSLFGLLRLSCIVRDEDFEPKPGCVCFLNGVLNLETYELMPHSPHYHLQTGRALNWDETANAPLFEQYLIDVFRDDEDRDIKIQFVKEWMGLCLVPETKYEKFVVCVGAGGNGKSVLLKLMPELLGAENVYSAPIQRLGNKRSLAELHGKLLLTSSEINENAVLDDGILKQIVSGDTIEAERKYEHPFTFKPCARIMLATNHLPKLRDVTHAFFRRLVLVEFNRIFTSEEMDMNLSEKLKGELDGIFVTAINGLKSLRERGEFVVPTSAQDAADDYRELSAVTEIFARDAIEPVVGEAKGMRPVALYDLYTRWCKAYGLLATNRIVFGKEISSLGFKKVRSRGQDFWHVQMTDSGKEILDKPPVRVDEFTIDPDDGDVEAGSNVVSMPVPVEQSEELKAA